MSAVKATCTRTLWAVVMALASVHGAGAVQAAEPGDDAGEIEDEARVDPVLAERRDKAQALVRRGQELAGMGRREEALAAFGAALEVYPAYPLAHHELGVSFADLGDLEKAAASFERALALAPDFARARQALGEVRRRQKRFGEALDQFKAALAVAPEDVATWYGVAATLRAQKKNGEALHALRRLVRAADNPMAPPVIEANKEIAALDKAGVREVAWGVEGEPDAVGETPTPTPTVATAPGTLTRHDGDAEFTERRYLAALERYLGAWSDEGPDAVLAYKIGATFAVMNDDRQALAWWRKALAIDPGRELVARHLALLVAKLRQSGAEVSDGGGDGGDAVARAKEALRLGDPGSALFLVKGSDRPGAAAVEAEARLRLGDFARARAIFEELLGEDPEDRVAKGGLAETLLRMGQAGAAEKAIQAWVGSVGSEGGYKARPETFLVFRRGEVEARLLAPPEPED